MSIKVKIRRGTTFLGELSMEELTEKLGSGRISVYDELYYEKEDKWIKINEISDIATYAGEDYHWKYRISGEVKGPLAKDDLIFFIREGKILENTWVFHPCLGEWKKLQDISEFKQIAEEVNVEKKPEGTLGEAFKSSFYKTCPVCGMQNLSSVTSCKGCKYLFKGNE